MLIPILAIVLAALVPGPQVGLRGLAPGERLPFDPRTYRSDSGAFELRVVPSDPSGEGPAEYRLAREGVELWKRELPFTLEEVGLADDGSFAGYGQTEGARFGGGMLRIAFVAADASVVRYNEHAHSPGGCISQPEGPWATGAFLLGSDAPHAGSRASTFVLRVGDNDWNRQSEAWWFFDFATGKELTRAHPLALEPDAKSLHLVLGAAPVRGTPLVIVAWNRVSDLTPTEYRHGTRFVLYAVRPEARGEAALSRVWSLDLPDDFERPKGAPWFDTDAAFAGKEHASILRWDEPRRFDLWFTKEDQRVTFEVAGDAQRGWDVREIARASATPAVDATMPRASTPAEPIPTLASLGAVDLDPCQDPRSEVHDVGEFAFDGEGHIAFLRWEQEPDRAVLVYVDRKGALIAKHVVSELGGKNGHVSGDLAWIGGSRFVIARSPYSHDGRTGEAWIVDARTGKAEHVDCELTRDVHGLASFADGRFVVLGDNRLYAFDARGAHLWTRTSADQLCGADDVAVTADGRIVLLDQIPDGLQWVDAKGKIGRYAKLDELWSRAPRYPVRLQADLGGGLLLEDDDRLVAMDAEGRPRSVIVPRFADGRALKSFRCVQPGRDGRRWTTDHGALYALDVDGKVDETLGEGDRPERLGEACDVELGTNDRVYARAERSGRVFEIEVGDESKAKLVPAPAAHVARMWKGGLDLVDEGGAMVLLEHEGATYTRWSLAGERIGTWSAPPVDWGQRVLPQPSKSRAWVLEKCEVALVERDGEIVRRTKRRPDDTWMRNVGMGCVAPDGSLAVLDEDVLLFDADGKPKGLLGVEHGDDAPHSLAYDGARVVWLVHDQVRVHDVAKGTQSRFRLPGVDAKATAYWKPFLPRSRAELWLFDGGHTIRRYSLPR